MAMRPCDKCLDNRWTYELPDQFTVRATCQNCGAEVEFLTKRGKRAAGLWPKRPKKISKKAARRYQDLRPSESDMAIGYVPFQHGPGPGDDPNELPW